MTIEIELKSAHIDDESPSPSHSGPTCPTCGSPTHPEQHYTGGTYRFFACCTRNPEHQAVTLS
jgi:hypothetical protein